MERLISADSHVGITPDWIKGRLPKNASEAFDEAMKAFNAYQEEQQGPNPLKAEDFGDMAPGATDPGFTEPNARLRAMDRDGVYAEVLYSDLSAFRQFHLAGEYWKPIARAFNDCLSDFAAVNPDRLVVSYQVPIIDVDYAVSEVHRLAALQARSVHLPNYPTELGFPPYHDSSYDPLWAALSETNISISHHLGIKNSLYETYRADPTPLKSIFTSMPGLMIVENLSFWLMTGLLERFPKLQIVFVEPNFEIFVMWLKALDKRWNRGGQRLFPGVTKLPSETFHEQVSLTIIGGEADNIALRHDVGVRNVMWSTDFPHPASSWPNSVKIVEEAFADVPAEERQLILAGNAARVYNLAAA
jgi:uncharacterized protein